jgi:L-ascorbate metabolism protein UlaG (beta-lactamase superfamily)
MRRAVFTFSALLICSLSWGADEFASAGGPIRITPIQHASLMIEAGGKVIQVDPCSQNTEAKYAALPKADLILITDFHSDHMDPRAIGWVQKADTRIIAPAVVTASLRRGETIKNGQTTTWGEFTIEAVPMYNMRRGPNPGRVWHERGRGNGYVITYGGKRIYVSGDTEAIAEMRALGHIDIAFVCMNLPYTMSPAEAAEAVRAFVPQVVYPYHYRGSDLQAFTAALKGTPIEVRLADWYK